MGRRPYISLRGGLVRLYAEAYYGRNLVSSPKRTKE